MNTAEQKKVFLEAMTLHKPEYSTIFKQKKVNKFFNKTVYEVIIFSLLLLAAKEISLVIWKQLN